MNQEMIVVATTSTDCNSDVLDFVFTEPIAYNGNDLAIRVEGIETTYLPEGKENWLFCWYGEKQLQLPPLEYCSYVFEYYDDGEKRRAYDFLPRAQFTTIAGDPAIVAPLADIVATGANNTWYIVAEDLQIVQKAPKAGCVFVTDGNGNWMKVVAEGDVYDAIAAMDCIKGGTLKGVLANANFNQTLTVVEAPTQGEAPIGIEPVAWNLPQSDPQSKFAPKVNEVIALTGYWSSDDNAFSAYYSEPRGQSISADFSWCNTDATVNDGQLYTNVVCTVQLKAPWDAESTPAKVAAGDDLSYRNYLVYPMEVSGDIVVTGFENLSVSKDVVSVRYTNVAGQMSSTPFDGVNIVITRYSDGSITNEKKILK
ncbi:MAG: hypothetical protein IJT30_10580 [Muribaculaceae bacterium]|nr:hypothetical protein [Muribaculaceae bacterium]